MQPSAVLVYFERDILARNLEAAERPGLRVSRAMPPVISDMKSYFDENMRLLDDGSMDALFPDRLPSTPRSVTITPTRYVAGSSRQEQPAG